jgi:hypothetical protein
MTIRHSTYRCRRGALERAGVDAVALAGNLVGVAGVLSLVSCRDALERVRVEAGVFARQPLGVPALVSRRDALERAGVSSLGLVRATAGSNNLR